MRIAFRQVNLVKGKDLYFGMYNLFFSFWFFFFATSSACFFFEVDFSRACISCGTMEDLPSRPKLHMYLEWPWKNDINDNICGLVVWCMGMMGGFSLCRLKCL